MRKKIKYNCVFGGGGIRGISYIGAINALNDLKIEIDALAGSSVGAVFASLLAIGYNPDEIKEIVSDFNLKVFRDINISLFSEDISLCKGQIFLEWIREKIEKKYYKNLYKKGQNVPVLFKDIKRNLQILSVDISTNTPFIFSKDTTPNAEIAFAIRASASLPGLMKPVRYKNAILVDGDLIKSWPAWKVFSSLNNETSRILEFRIEGSRNNPELKNYKDYINSIINTIWFFSTENLFNFYHENDRYDFIIIDTKDIILFDFNLDTYTRNALIDNGYNTVIEYFTNIIKKKQKIILNIYDNILNRIKIIKSSIINDDIEKAMYLMSEVTSDTIKYKNYIDEFFLKKIHDIKDFLRINSKKIYFKKLKINKKNHIIRELNFLENSIKQRILDIL